MVSDDVVSDQPTVWDVWIFEAKDGEAGFRIRSVNVRLLHILRIDPRICYWGISSITITERCRDAV